MIDALYWWDEAEKYRECAHAAEDAQQQQEFIELAAVCEDVAVGIEERATGG